MINIFYFARLREQLGSASETLEPVTDVGSVMAQLKARGGAWAEVFGGGERVLISVNQEMAGPDTQLADGDEVAFFPPVTGG